MTASEITGSSSEMSGWQALTFASHRKGSVLFPRDCVSCPVFGKVSIQSRVKPRSSWRSVFVLPWVCYLHLLCVSNLRQLQQEIAVSPDISQWVCGGIFALDLSLPREGAQLGTYLEMQGMIHFSFPSFFFPSLSQFDLCVGSPLTEDSGCLLLFQQCLLPKQYFICA